MLEHKFNKAGEGLKRKLLRLVALDGQEEDKLEAKLKLNR